MARARRRVLAGLVALVATVVLLAGCTEVVDGRVAARPESSTSPDFPRQSAGETTPSAPGPSTGPSTGPSATPSQAPNGIATATNCPTVRYPYARLQFRCLLPTMIPTDLDTVWPLAEYATVEPATGWQTEEGAGRTTNPHGEPLATIAGQVRSAMISADAYGPTPGVQTVANRPITVSGRPARLLQSTITLSAAARAIGTAVRQERLWIVAVQVAPGTVSLWFVTVPDLVKKYWATVPSLISSITVI